MSGRIGLGALALRAVIIAVVVVAALQFTESRRDRTAPVMPPTEAAGAAPGSAAPAERGSIDGLGLREDDTPMRDQPGWTPPTKVVVQDIWPGRTVDLAAVAPGVSVVVVANALEAQAEVSDADALLGLLTPALFDAGNNLRWVQLASAGVERYLAIPGFVESDIVLTNAQRIFAPGGAEHALAMMLALARRVPQAIELQRQRTWDTEPVTGPTPYTGDGSEMIELRGRTLLVAGLGGIGTETARIASGLGMRVIATRNSSREGPEFVDYVGLSNELPTLISQADVIVNALPLTEGTRQIFDAGAFAAMKPSALYVSLGRGGTTDTDALVEALRSGRLGGAALDVTDPEPLPTDHELWGMPNVIITPHVGGDSDAHQERMYRLFEENLRRFVAGDALLSVVGVARGY